MPSTLIPLAGAMEPDDGDETVEDDDALEDAKPDDEPEASDDDEADGKPATTAPVDQVQSTALNGAQIQSLVQIVAEVTDGTMTIEAAEALIRISFPAVADSAIAALIAALAIKPTKPKPTAPPPSAPGTQPPKPEPPPSDDGEPPPQKPVPKPPTKPKA
jgi:hypothetical protein